MFWELKLIATVGALAYQSYLVVVSGIFIAFYYYFMKCGLSQFFFSLNASERGNSPRISGFKAPRTCLLSYLPKILLTQP